MNNDNIFYEEDSGDFDSKDFEEDRKKKIRIILIIVGIIVALLLIIYIAGVFYYSSHFLPKTEVNGINVGNQTAEQALQTINSDIANRQLMIEGDDNQTDVVSSTEIDLVFDNDAGDLEHLLHDQNEFYWQVNSFGRHIIDLHTDYRYDENKLNEVISKLSLVSGANVHPPENARVDYNGQEFVIVPAVEGNQPNSEALADSVVHHLLDNELVLNLNTAHIYNTAEIKADSPALKEELNKCNSILNASITITFPTKSVVLNKDTFAPWIVHSTESVNLDDNSVNNYVAQLAAEFNNNGDNLSFKATNGKTYYFTYNSGWQLNQQAEAAQLKDFILKGTVQTVNPIWSAQGSNYITGDSINTNYIEISISNQTLWFYRNNVLVSTSTVVTGNVGSRQDTATGLYFLQAKDTNVNLVVRMPDGNNTNTQVKYWLPFSRNHGIESATWRTNFGGDIYRTQGTDGDIDVPEDMARTLYNDADLGIPIVIY